MKRKTIPAVITLMMIFAASVFAESGDGEESPFTLKLQTDFAYYTHTDRQTGGTHFAPITGPYEGPDLRTILDASYKFNTPLGENFLLKDANVVLTGGIELTPLTFRPKVSVEFTPVPFLVFKAGASVGLGWNIGDVKGLCELDEITFDYENLSTFSHPYYDLWASATFQFDTGALIPGDWTHVVMLASYTTTYSAIAGLDSDAIYIWQNSKNKVRGLSYEFQGILAYQMPLVLYRAGLMYKMNGYYDGSNYGIYDDNFDGTFAEISISPLAQLKFGEKDELAVLVDFSSRRSFDAEISKESESLLRNKLGREWFFKRLALSWTHRFI